MTAVGFAADVQEVRDAVGKIGTHDEGAVAVETVQVQLIKRIGVAEYHRTVHQVQGTHLAVGGQLPVRPIAYVQAGDILQLAFEPGAVFQVQMCRAAIFDNDVAFQPAAIDIHARLGTAVDFQQHAIATGQG